MQASAQLAAMLGGWEVILVLVLILILIAAKWLPEQSRGSHQESSESDRSVRRALLLFVAQGFGAGRIPFAPGTFGSVVGVLWFAFLVWLGNWWVYLATAIEGIAFSIWLCDEAEEILGEKDPGSVVLDEIIAIPFCFLPWVLAEWLRRGHVMPPVETFFHGRAWFFTCGVFLLFRLFDVWKPWPIRRLQDLPGGWGVTIDDLLAAVYVALLTLLFTSVA